MSVVWADLQAHDEGNEPKHPAEEQQHNNGHHKVVGRFGLNDDSGPYRPGLHHLWAGEGRGGEGRGGEGGCDLLTCRKQSMYDLH